MYNFFAIQKIKNSYDFCKFKLLNLKIEEYNMFKQKTDSETALNNYFNSDCLSICLSFEHRFVSKTAFFIHKIMNCSTSPQILAKEIEKRSEEVKKHNLRNLNEVSIPQIKTRSGEETFSYFFSNFHNKILFSYINYSDVPINDQID